MGSKITEIPPEKSHVSFITPMGVQYHLNVISSLSSGPQEAGEGAVAVLPCWSPGSRIVPVSNRHCSISGRHHKSCGQPDSGHKGAACWSTHCSGKVVNH